jgi:hypothetical protein
LAGYFRFIWSNLCTRNIPKKLTPRGHEHWPDKSRSVYRSPAVVVITTTNHNQPDLYLIIDGYKRIVVLRQLGLDTVEAVVWPMNEAEAP